MSLDFYLYYDFDGHEFEAFERNITHNLGKMAHEAGIYLALWRPEEINATHAKDIIPALEAGLKKLKELPAIYKTYNSPSGWGLYENFVPFVEAVLDACKEYPNARIKVSR